MTSRLWVRNQILASLDVAPDDVHLFSHHKCLWLHALVSSGWRDADVLVLDQHTEWETVSGVHASLDLAVEQTTSLQVRFPHSLGTLAFVVAMWAGLRPQDGVWSLPQMALYGEPRFRSLFEQLMPRTDHGFELAPGFIRFERFEAEPIVEPWTSRLIGLLGEPRDARIPWTLGPGVAQAVSEMDQHVADVVASFQAVVIDRVLHLTELLHASSETDRLILTGPVAANAALVRAVVDEGPYGNVRVPWTVGNAGAAIGAAALGTMTASPQTLISPIPTPYLGPDIDSAVDMAMCEKVLPVRWKRFMRRGDPEAVGSTLDCRDFDDDQTALISAVVEDLSAGTPVAWMRGRLAYGDGPHADRVILADPRPEEVLKKVRTTITGAPPFVVPWAYVLEEDASELLCESEGSRQAVRWGLCRVRVASAHTEAFGPAVGPDGQASVIVCGSGEHSVIHALLSEWKARHGTGVLLGWSLAEHDRPAVAKSADALLMFAGTGLQSIVVEDTVLRKVLA